MADIYRWWGDMVFLTIPFYLLRFDGMNLRSTLIPHPLHPPPPSPASQCSSISDVLGPPPSRLYVIYINTNIWTLGKEQQQIFRWGNIYCSISLKPRVVMFPLSQPWAPRVNSFSNTRVLTRSGWEKRDLSFVTFYVFGTDSSVVEWRAIRRQDLGSHPRSS